MALDATQLETALSGTGERLDSAGVQGPVRLYLVGGTAAMLSGLLSPGRTTGDADVTRCEPQREWSRVQAAAAAVAKELKLPNSWLNDQCSIYAWCLPLGWQGRCQPIRAYPPLEILSLSRRDVIATKVISAPRRPQDLEDLQAINPTPDEITFTEQHIDRLEREHLDPDHSFNDSRLILNALRVQP